jgi:ketosteroid isomerase-like protein
MKRARLYPVLMMALGLWGCQEKKPDIVANTYPDDQKRLQEVVNDIFAKAKAKELDQLDAYHLHSPKFSKFEEEGIFTRRNIDEARKTENEAFSAISDFNYEVQEFKADVFGDVAVTTFYFQYTAKMGVTPIGGRIRGTLIFAKVGNDWKIVHEHFSYFPATPAS